MTKTLSKIVKAGGLLILFGSWIFEHKMLQNSEDVRDRYNVMYADMLHCRNVLELSLSSLNDIEYENAEKTDSVATQLLHIRQHRYLKAEIDFIRTLTELGKFDTSYKTNSYIRDTTFFNNEFDVADTLLAHNTDGLQKRVEEYNKSIKTDVQPRLQAARIFRDKLSADVDESSTAFFWLYVVGSVCLGFSFVAENFFELK